MKPLPTFSVHQLVLFFISLYQVCSDPKFHEAFRGTPRSKHKTQPLLCFFKPDTPFQVNPTLPQPFANEQRMFHPSLAASDVSRGEVEAPVDCTAARQVRAAAVGAVRRCWVGYLGLLVRKNALVLCFAGVNKRNVWCSSETRTPPPFCSLVDALLLRAHIHFISLRKCQCNILTTVPPSMQYWAPGVGENRDQFAPKVRTPLHDPLCAAMRA